MKNEEILKAVKKCKTAEELVKLAKENNKKITIEKAQEILNSVHNNSRDLSNDELEKIVGGATILIKFEFYNLVKFRHPKDVTFVVDVNQTVYFKPFDNSNARYGTVVSKKVGSNQNSLNGNKDYLDYYQIKDQDPKEEKFYLVKRNQIAKN